MKTLVVLATAATVALSGSAFASNFDGSISAGEFAARHFAETSYEQGDGKRRVFDVEEKSTSIATSNRKVTPQQRTIFIEEKEFRARD